MDFFNAWWTRIRYSDAFMALPEWLRDPPGLYILVGVVLLTAVLLLTRLVRGVLGGRGGRQSGRRQLRREIRQLEKSGDWRGVAQRYENLGQPKKALDAYRRGGLIAEQADLLVRLGKSKQAKDVAREGEAWGIYAELCEADGELGEAAAAFERSDQIYAAARCYEKAGDRDEAARCYQVAGMDARAIELLSEGSGPEAATTLEAAVRGSLPESGPLSPEVASALRRCCQLWIDAKEPRRAYQLAVDSGQWDVVVPIVRDFLPPSLETAEACLRAEAFLPAAEIFSRLGETRQEALARGEHYGRREEHREAAEWWERAEEWGQAAEAWAAAGDLEPAAENFEKAGDLQQAADLHGRCGNVTRQRDLLQRLGAVSVGFAGGGPLPEDFDDDPTAVMQPGAPEVRMPTAPEPVTPQPGAPVPAAPQPGAPQPGAPQPAAPVVPVIPPTEPELPEASAMQAFMTDGQPPTWVDPTGRPTPAGGMPAEPPSVLSPAERRYVLKEELGRGGMGVVYRAEDLMLKRSVAYKMLPKHHLGNEQEAESLLAEARAAARLSHPNIVQVYDAGRNDDGFFIVMELIDGKDFGALLQKRKLSVAGAIRVGRQICSALAHAHQRRIIHRDLKPSNLMWTSEKQVKLTDFGLARAFEDSIGKVQTQPAGTPFYMAPEQIRGDPVEPLTDIYSFGCVLYELLCNSGPFSDGGSTLYHHLNSPPRDPRYHREEIPEDLALLVLRCLDKDAHQRPESASAVGKALAKIGKGGG